MYKEVPEASYRILVKNPTVDELTMTHAKHVQFPSVNSGILTPVFFAKTHLSYNCCNRVYYTFNYLLDSNIVMSKIPEINSIFVH